MVITRRQPGNRRWGWPAEFPLVDGAGLLVSVDRRRFQNRRKATIKLEEVEILLSQLSAKDDV